MFISAQLSGGTVLDWRMKSIGDSLLMAQCVLVVLNIATGLTAAVYYYVDSSEEGENSRMGLHIAGGYFGILGFVVLIAIVPCFLMHIAKSMVIEKNSKRFSICLLATEGLGGCGVAFGVVQMCLSLGAVMDKMSTAIIVLYVLQTVFTGITAVACFFGAYASSQAYFALDSNYVFFDPLKRGLKLDAVKSPQPQPQNTSGQSVAPTYAPSPASAGSIQTPQLQNVSSQGLMPTATALISPPAYASLVSAAVQPHYLQTQYAQHPQYVQHGGLHAMQPMHHMAFSGGAYMPAHQTLEPQSYQPLPQYFHNTAQ